MQPTSTCPLCRSTESTPWIEGEDHLTHTPGRYLFLQCCRCTFIYLQTVSQQTVSLQTVSQQSAQLYPDDYEFFTLHEQENLSWLQNRAQNYGLQKRRRIVQKACKRERGTLLDVGCANGAFLATMQTAGWAVEGVEPNPTAANMARRRNLKIHQIDFAAVDLPTDYYDVITLWGVFEHIPNPLAMLRKLATLLKPDGTVLMLLPNPEGVDAKIFGSYWAGLDIPRHLSLFSWNVLQSSLRMAGFSHAERRWDYTPYQLWRYSLEFWLNAHVSETSSQRIKSALRSPFAQAATWPLLQPISYSKLNSILVVAAYR